jgi:hypothetical protein
MDLMKWGDTTCSSHFPAIVRNTRSQVKLGRSLDDDVCCHALWNETFLQSWNVFCTQDVLHAFSAFIGCIFIAVIA